MPLHIHSLHFPSCSCPASGTCLGFISMAPVPLGSQLGLASGKPCRRLEVGRDSVQSIYFIRCLPVRLPLTGCIFRTKLNDLLTRPALPLSSRNLSLLLSFQIKRPAAQPLSLRPLGTRYTLRPSCPPLAQAPTPCPFFLSWPPYRGY